MIDDAAAPKKDRFLLVIVVLLVAMLVAVVALNSMIGNTSSAMEMKVASEDLFRITVNVTAVSEDISMKDLIVDLHAPIDDVELNGTNQWSPGKLFATSNLTCTLIAYDKDGSETLTAGDWMAIEPVDGALFNGLYEIKVYSAGGSNGPVLLGEVTIDYP